jgi:hypothetical protein
MTGSSTGSPANEEEVPVASDDGRRSSNGVVACLVDSPDGTTKLVFDDVVADGEKNPVRWSFETFFTHKQFASVAFDESRLSDSDYRLIGENLVFRLLALNGRVK